MSDTATSCTTRFTASQALGGSPVPMEGVSPAGQAHLILNPTSHQTNQNLQTFILQLTEENRPENSRNVCNNKIAEFFQHCDLVYPNDLYKYYLTFDKVYKFMFYQAFREQKKAGTTKANIKKGIFFNKEEFDAMVDEFAHTPGHLVRRPTPKKPISESCCAQHKQVFRKIYKVEIARGCQNKGWDHIWQEPLDQVYRIVKTRKASVRKANYEEKVGAEFAPCLTATKHPNMEEEAWFDSQSAGIRRNVCAHMRHRYCLLHLTSGMLRCESLHRAELSDFLGIFLPQVETHIHPMFVMINRIPEGKTNHGRVLYGRATRHRDVRLCCVGALSFYLMHRFFLTNEFEHYSAEDWLDNKKWFDVKLLVNASANDLTAPLKKDSCAKHVKKILLKLKIVCSKILHLGRNLGSRILELMETESEHIRKMGQWDPSQFDKAYSTKLPIQPMRQLAGYSASNKIYFNTRTSIFPPQELLLATPIGKWVYTAFDETLEAAEGKQQTCLHFLRFLQNLNLTFLQDSAVMQAYFPDRSSHPVFQDLEVFSMPQWQDYLATMKNAMDTEECPLDASLEKVLPGMHQWQSANHAAVTRLNNDLSDFRQSVDEFQENVSSRLSTIETTVSASTGAVSQCLNNHRISLATAMWRASHMLADNVLKGSSGTEADFLREVAQVRNNNNPHSTPERPNGGADGVAQLPPFNMDMNFGRGNSPPAEDNTSPSPGIPDNNVANCTFRMRLKHTRLVDMHNEWHGLSEFDDGHGGVSGRDKKCGSKWRKKIIDNNQYSRTKRIVLSIEKIAEEKEVPVHEAIELLQPLFDQCRHALSKFVSKMQEEGYIKKNKARGKATAARAATVSPST